MRFLPSQRWRYQNDLRAYLRSARAKGAQSRPPIFICGCGHSGTSLTLAVLGSHSRIYAVPFETNFAFLGEADRRKLLAAFDRHARANAKTRWVEKTPSHIKAMQLLLDTHPEARVIVMWRDGRDVVCSLRARNGDFAASVKRWIKDNAAAEPFLKNPRVHILKYEDIVDHFETSTRAMADFLGEQFEPGMLEFHKTPRTFYANKIEKPVSAAGKNHEAHRNWQINQPLFDGRGRWLKEMSAEEKDIFKKSAAPLLIEQGYAQDDRW